MARSALSDTRFLEQKNGKWRVTVAVPRDLHGKLSTRLKQDLKTDSLAVANRLKWPIIAGLKATIERARGLDGSGRDTLTFEAMELATRRGKATAFEELDAIDTIVTERVEAILGPPMGIEADPDTGAPVEVHDFEREQQARRYAALATGNATPIGAYHAQFVAQTQNKARTKADDERALKYLRAWCDQDGTSPTLQAITRKAATRFMDDLSKLSGGLSPVTLNKYLFRLSRYWQWLERREHVETNVWARLKLTAPAPADGEEERAFTDAEVAKLLSGPATSHMHDLMQIGALTGARLDAIVDLKVGGCLDGLFTFKRQKKEKAARFVPIHPDLKAIVARRTAGKGPDDDLFPEWPGPKKAGSLRERSFKASNAFTAYRRSVGVDEVITGKRRSLVNFHSFRRWFITKAERADQPESIIAVVVGHRRQGMTLGRYSAGPLMEQARRCVEAVRLPAVPDRR